MREGERGREGEREEGGRKREREGREIERGWVGLEERESLPVSADCLFLNRLLTSAECPSP